LLLCSSYLFLEFPTGCLPPHHHPPTSWRTGEEIHGLLIPGGAGVRSHHAAIRRHGLRRNAVEHCPVEVVVRAARDQCWRRSRHAASTRLELHELVAFLIALCACVNTSTSYNRSNRYLRLVHAWPGAIQRIESVRTLLAGAILSPSSLRRKELDGRSWSNIRHDDAK
jgi:hypothetical protein